jgi:radical SAM superfamily enzyme YgiQ (UPF0313 family)
VKKVVLISPPNDFAGNSNVVRFTLPLAPPLSILTLGSYLAAHDVPVELIDVQMDFGFGLTHAAERVVFQRVAQYLREQASNIAWIGISQLSNAGSGLALAKEIHAVLPNIPIVFGGYFPSSNYRALLEKYPFITAIVRGDGEAAALQISHSIDEGQPFLSDKTPNLAWLEGEIHTTPTQSMPLDGLPILDFRLLRSPVCYPIIDLMTSRGCPFQCNYCLESSMRPYAKYPSDWVARQLEYIETELPNDRVFIYDPVFGLGRKQTLELCQVLGKHRFTCAVESRVDVFAPDLVPVLHEAGVETVYWGIESASADTLLRMNKVRSKDEAEDYIRKALRLLEACFRSNITPFIGFMLSFPGDSERDYQASLKFMKNVGQLYNQITEQTGTTTGFVPFAFFTKIYNGNLLAELITRDFPEAVLRSEPFIGERVVLSPSPGLDLDVTRHYQTAIVRQGVYTSVALERLRRYYAFSMEAFLAAHPELTDTQGVTVLGDSLRLFAQDISMPAMLMNFDKSRH